VRSGRSSDATTFSPDYFTARERFREAADRLGWFRQSYPIGPVGPNGADLTIDMASSSRAGTARVLVISSGLHGVEGFLGSAVQLGMLHRWHRAGGAPRGLRCVLLHALNPYGFAWFRRADAENIDLNRNFLAEGMDYCGGPASYAGLDGLLNPRRPPSRVDLFHLKALWTLARHGKRSLTQAIVSGQYDFPAGLFFGGKAPAKTHRILQRHMRSWIGDAMSVVHLDFHTGLGAWGTYKLLIDYSLNARQREWIERWLGSASYEETGAGELAYRAAGSLGQWCLTRAFAPEYLFAFAEFGTYGHLRVLAGLRAENQAHHWGERNEARTVRAKQRLRELFCPASTKWRSRVLAQGIALVQSAVNGLER
jgi:Protein of unknown function (DUF2817)